MPFHAKKFFLGRGHSPPLLRRVHHTLAFTQAFWIPQNSSQTYPYANNHSLVVVNPVDNYATGSSAVCNLMSAGCCDVTAWQRQSRDLRNELLLYWAVSADRGHTKRYIKGLIPQNCQNWT